MGDYFLFFIFIMGMRDSNLDKIYWKHLVISLSYMTLDNVNVLDVSQNSIIFIYNPRFS